MIVLADINSWNVGGCSQGHYLAVAENYNRIFRKVDFKVAGGPVYKGVFPASRYIELPFDVLKGQNAILRKWHNVRNFLVLMSNLHDGDTVIFQASSQFAVLLCIVMLSRRNVRIFMIQYSKTECLSNVVKRTLWKLAKCRIRGVICPSDETGEVFGLPYCVVPDYIAIGEAYDKNEVPSFDFVFCGTITEKKGVVEAVGSLAPKGWKILVAGRPSSQNDVDCLTAIHNQYGNVMLRLGYLSGRDFDDAIYSAKAVVLNYAEAYSAQSSGIVFDALFRLRPILGRRCVALDFIERYNMGELYEDIDDVDINRFLSFERLADHKRHIMKYLAQHLKYEKTLKSFVIGDSYSTEASLEKRSCQ